MLHRTSDISPAESSRLQALRRSGLLTRSNEAQFSRLSNLVRQMLGTPVALVSFIDSEVQMFVGQHGLPAEVASAGETPLSHSFCRHVVDRQEPLIIDDARRDDVLCTNPAVDELGVMAYLGVPLSLPSGEIVGALAAIDIEPRHWTQDDLGKLQAIAEAVKHEMAVRISETKWRMIFEGMQDGFYVCEALRDADGRVADFRMELANPVFAGLVGMGGDEVGGQTLGSLLDGAFAPLVGAHAQVLESQGKAVFETRLSCHPGEWFEGRIRALDEARIAVTFARITERKDTEIRLRDAEERRRLALETGEVGLWDLDVRSRTLTVDARVRNAYGVFEDRALDLPSVVAAVHSQDRGAFDVSFRQALSGDGDRFELQYRANGIGDGVTRWLLVKGRVLRDGFGQPERLVGAVRDVTDRVAADERRTVLNSELSHRLKNNFAVVQSIASQTLRSAPDVATARQSLLRRIQALSKAHDILLSGHLDGAPVRTVVENALLLHDDGAGRVDVEGPRVVIGDRAALTLSLIVNELATNAGKYGALSAEAGRVEVSWSVAPGGGDSGQVLDFEWRETGGPPVVAPERVGFGSRLIELGLSGSPDSATTIDYHPAGLHCRIVAPLAELREREAAAAN